MAMFGSSGRESYDALYDVLQKPADTSAMVREQTPGMFEGSQLGAVGTGLRRAGQRANLAIFDTFGLVEKPAFTALDEFFKTNLEEERQKEREELLKNFEETKLDPKTNGSAAQLLHGLGDVLGLTAGLALTRNPAIIAGATGTTYGYTQGVAGVQEGLDPVTAYSKGAIEGAAMGVSVALPAAMPGSLALRAATGAAMNVGVGIPERMAVSTLLKARGYSEMAQQYEPFDATSIMTELALGAAFGGLLGPRVKAAKLPKPEAVPPSAVDAALTANQARHAEIDAAPGIPVDTLSRNAHADALNVMHEAVLQGRDMREVNVEPLLREAGFIGKETDLDAVRVIAEELNKAGVKDLAEQVRSLEVQAKARGLAVDDVPMYSRDTLPGGATHIEVDGAQRPTLDSTGKTIHTTEDGVRNFWRWFSDSKAVDAEGKPLVVYHGTDREFSAFDFSKLGEFTRQNTDAKEAAVMAEIGVWTNTKPLAGRTVQRVDMPLYVSIKNPLHIRFDDLWDMAGKHKSGDGLRRAISKNGYDGLAVDDSEFGGTSYVTFHPNQIKSAIGNSGAFDLKNPDIRYSRATAKTIRQADAIRNGASRDDATDAARVLADHPKDEADRIAEAYDKRLRAEAEPSPYEAAQPDKIRLLMQAMDDVKADHSAPALTAAFRSMFGKDADRLLDTARLTIVQSVKDLPGSGHPADVGGMFWRGKAYIVADNTGLSQIRGRVLHEIGEHAGMRDMLGDELYKQVLDTVDRKTASDPIFKAAREFADARSNKPEHVQAETLAYLVENAPELPVVRRLLAAVRQWLYRVTGGRFVDLTQADLQMMAAASLRRYAREADIAERGGAPWYMTHSTLLRDWISRTRSPAALRGPMAAMDVFERVRRIVRGKELDYELRDVPVAEMKPTQFGDDYINDSSRGAAKSKRAARSMEDINYTGDVLPVLLDQQMNVLDGNHRHAAAVMNGEETIPALVPVGNGTGRIVNLPSIEGGAMFSRDGYPTRESVEQFHETANANKAPKIDPVDETTFPEARASSDQADAEIASANELSKGFLPAVDCAMRVGT